MPPPTNVKKNEFMYYIRENSKLEKFSETGIYINII